MDPNLDIRSTEPTVAPAARTWTQVLAFYREPCHSRSIFEIAVTLGPLLGLWVLGWFACYFGLWWLSLILAVPAASFLVRLFMIQHDCGHGAFFCARAANDWVGRVIGALTLTPYDFWRRTHAIHHASSGHLERRGIGDVVTLTLREYLARSFWGRFCYPTYRNPLVMFGLGPAYLFVLQQRLPVGMMRRGWQPWFSTMATKNRGHRCHVDLVCRHPAIPARAPTHYSARRLGRVIAILRPASVRADILGS
jgi:omega-6 fatty acid desaturase (delta-12 desaturase)